MSDELIRLIAETRNIQMTNEQSAEQRISFAYGNTYFENSTITRATVEEAARQLEETGNAKNGCSTG